jgi:hypothetical protein
MLVNSNLSMIYIRAFAFLFAALVLTANAQEPIAKKGLLDLSSIDLAKSKIALSGEWIHYENYLISPTELNNPNSGIAIFPKLWNDSRDSKSGTGFATYHLKVLLPEHYESPLALEIPQIYSCYKIWVDGKIVASNGVVGKTKENTTPQWLPQLASFERAGDSLSVVIQISNFHHHNGGSKDPIYLGTVKNLSTFHSRAITGNFAEAIVLTVIGTAFLIIFFLYQKQKVIMYFLLLCLTWALRSVFSNLYIAITIFPDFNWEIMVKIEYLTLYLTMIWAILFLGRLFYNESSKIVKYFLVIGNIFFIVFTIVTPALTYTRWLPAYLAFSAILIVYGIVIVIMALINDRAGGQSVIVGVLLGLVLFAYDIIAYEGILRYNAVVFSVGYIIIFSMLGTALLFHLRIFKSTSQGDKVLTFDELYNKPKK